MSAWLCHNDDEASPGTIFYNVSLKIVKINSAVLSTCSQFCKEARHSDQGGGVAGVALFHSNSFMKSFAHILKTDFIFL